MIAESNRDPASFESGPADTSLSDKSIEMLDEIIELAHLSRFFNPSVLDDALVNSFLPSMENPEELLMELESFGIMVNFNRVSKEKVVEFIQTTIKGYTYLHKKQDS